MEIRHVKIDFWITSEKGGKQFIDNEDVSNLVQDVKKYIESKGYMIPLEFCGLNPSIHISGNIKHMKPFDLEKPKQGIR